MFEVGAFLVGLGMVLIIRIERPEGFKHLFDKVWLNSDLSPQPIIVGRSAVVAKYLSRSFMLVGLTLIVAGATLGSW